MATFELYTHYETPELMPFHEIGNPNPVKAIVGQFKYFYSLSFVKTDDPGIWGNILIERDL